MKHWTHYWGTSGALNSFAEGEANQGYANSVKQFWESILAELPTDATVLDVGCGNGAIAALAVQYSQANNKQFNVEGADAAAIDPTKNVPANHPLSSALKQVRFHSEMPVEELAHANDSIDAIVSQFAIEYSDLDKAIAKFSDVVKPGGVVAALVHDSTSGLLKDSKQGIAIIEDVLDNTPLFLQADLLINLAKQAIPQLGQEKWNEFSHNRILVNAIKWTMDVLLERYSQTQQQVWIRDIVARVARTLDLLNQGQVEQAQQFLNMHYHLLAEHKQRLIDQEQAALSAKTIQSRLIKKLEQAGFVATADRMEVDGDKFAWAVTARKMSA
ncbi:class I SAM-dependent methyltransferase [Pseudidiomarina taiwanensis]|nr:class I SAM-dependent methyltransferase [Pseudidiomarina taiwanensis]